MKAKVAPLILFWLIIFSSSPAAAEDKVQVFGDIIQGDTEKKVTFVTGNVRIVQGSDSITCNRAEINLQDKVLFLGDNVIFSNAEIIIEANHLEYSMKKKNGTFTNNVFLKRKAEEKTNKSEKKDPFVLTTNELYFESNTKNFRAKVGRIEHKDFIGSGDVINYQDKLQKIDFYGRGCLKKSKGEEVIGDVIRVSLKDKNFKAEKKVTINFDVDDETDSPSS